MNNSVKALSVKDVAQGVISGLTLVLPQLVNNYVLVPFGIVVMMCVLYGINRIVLLIRFNFPASVLLMIINFFVLLILNVILPKKWFRMWYSIINVPMQFSLTWINAFFIPSFIVLPLSQPISVVEGVKITAIFIIGYLVLFVSVAYTCVLVQLLVGKNKAQKHNTSDGESDIELAEFTGAVDMDEESHITRKESFSNEIVHELQRPSPTYSRDSEVSRPSHSQPMVVSVSKESSTIERDTRPGTSSDPQTSNLHTIETTTNLDDLSDSAKLVASYTVNYIDWIVYSLLFVAGIPIYYTTNITLFIHLALTILCFFIALLITPNWRRFFHPILVSVAIILLFVFVFSIIKSRGHNPKDTFLGSIETYRTGRNYLNLFNSKKYGHQWPGAGDLLSSLMDISIVSLSLPMFSYRHDLVSNFFVLVPPILISCGLSFFAYPVLCYHVGLSSSFSLGFVGRSVTLALGTPLTTALGGSVSLMSVCVILSGILGVLSGELFLGPYGLRIRSDDYVTRGITLGINCGAISTAHLLKIDPRAASMASLSFSLFGTLMVIMSAIGPLTNMIRGWVGW